MKLVVIKCGGSVLESLPTHFYENIVRLQKSGEWQPIIVHGGGPIISEMLERLQIEAPFVRGMRVTTEAVLDVVEMVLSATVNKKIVRKLHAAGGRAFGLSGVDGNVLSAEPLETEHDLGFVGQVADVRTELLQALCTAGNVPVLSPVSADKEGQRYNINADLAASAVASALQATLCYVSDVNGIYEEKNGEKQYVTCLDERQANEWLTKEKITGGMIPKVEAALDALRQNVPEAVLIGGTEKDALLRFCEGERIGTRFVRGSEPKGVETDDNEYVTTVGP